MRSVLRVLVAFTAVGHTYQVGDTIDPQDPEEAERLKKWPKGAAAARLNNGFVEHDEAEGEDVVFGDVERRQAATRIAALEEQLDDANNRIEELEGQVVAALGTQYNRMNATELRALCESRQIPIADNATKAEMIKLLEAAPPVTD